jgi:high affinity sulfate transporter 1
MAPPPTDQATNRKLARVFPPVEWLPRYQKAWLSADAIAGVTLAAYAIPVSLAYASLAGLPPEHGIYCYLLGGLGYALCGSARQLAIGPTSAISMLVGATLAGMVDGDAARHASIAALTALVVAALGGLAWLLRLSNLVNFISETILVGFKAGAALTIAMTQLPKLFAVPGGGDNFFERGWILAAQLSETNWLVFGLGLGCLVLLVAGDRWMPGRPVALFVVIIATTVVSLAGLAVHGVPTVGTIPSGLPAFAWPALRFRDVDGVLPLAAACFLLAYVEGISAARALAEKHGCEVDPRQELLALGTANFAAALGQGYPVAGGLSQSAVNDKAGAKTPLALVLASATIGFCLLFLTNLLRNLPSVALAAIVLVAVRGLIDLAALRRLWRVSRSEFNISLIAVVGVLLFGILKGVLLAVLVSLGMLLRTAARPNVAFLARIPGTRRYSDRSRHPDNEPVPGVLIFRVEASLLYFNAQYVRNLLVETCAAAAGLRLVVCDLSNSPQVDLAAATMLAKLARELAARGVQFRLAEPHAQARDLLRATGLEQQIGYFGRYMTVDQALVEFDAQKPPT